MSRDLVSGDAVVSESAGPQLRRYWATWQSYGVARSRRERGLRMMRRRMVLPGSDASTSIKSIE